MATAKNIRLPFRVSQMVVTSDIELGSFQLERRLRCDANSQQWWWQLLCRSDRVLIAEVSVQQLLISRFSVD